MMLQAIKAFLVLCCFISINVMGQTGDVPSGVVKTNEVLAQLLKPDSSRVFIAAHRGGYESDEADGAPENSEANILNCRSKGYELFETDIQRTKDGHFVMIHDPTIKRELSGEGRASSLTLAELKVLHKRYRDGTLSGERVATFEEFLEGGKGVTVFKADMKRGVSKYFAELMQLVVTHDALEEVIFRVPYGEVELYHQYIEDGGVTAQHTLMFMVASREQIDDVRERFDLTTIEILLDPQDPTNEMVLGLIRYASEKGFLVETHADGTEEDWLKLVEAGVRMFHTKTPSRVKEFLENHGVKPKR